MRRLLALALLLAVPAAGAEAAGVSCSYSTEQQLRARAQVIFVGVALDGPATEDGFLVSPARFRVLRYLKSRGPRVVRVTTAVSRQSNGTYAYLSESVLARAGEPWRIYGRRNGRGVIIASPCSGSRIVRG